MMTLASFRKRASELSRHEDWLCFFCGVNVANTREHVLPASRYRSFAGDVDNHVPACEVCNRLKGALAIWDWLPLLQRRFMNVVASVHCRKRGGWRWA